MPRQAAWTQDVDYPWTENIDFRDAWVEADHPRGQPKNAGQWVKGGKAGPAAEAAKTKAAKSETTSATTPSESAGDAERTGQFAQAAKSKTPASALMPEVQRYGKHEIKAIGNRLARKANAEAEIALAEQKIAEHGPQKDSKKANTQPNGEYTPERKLRHQRLLEEMFNDEAVERATPAPGQRPLVTFLGGRGGSGKSSLTDPRKQGPVDAAHAIVIDADHFKGKLPEYQGWNAYEVHEESADLVDEAEKWARRLGLNVVHDATLKSSKGVNLQVANYKDRGYDVAGHYMHTRPEVAAQRAMERYANGIRKDGKGRYVPPEIILGNTDNERNFDALIPHFNKGWSLWDNNGAKAVRVTGDDDGRQTGRDRAAKRGHR